jgi:hypothetical protein
VFSHFYFRLYTTDCGVDGDDCNSYCMIKWMVPSPATWGAVNETLVRERKDDCNLDYNEIDGLKFLENRPLSTSLNEEFAKCFKEETIYNEGSDDLGLFCFFGDFRKGFSGRSDMK